MIEPKATPRFKEAGRKTCKRTANETEEKAKERTGRTELGSWEPEGRRKCQATRKGQRHPSHRTKCPLGLRPDSQQVTGDIRKRTVSEVWWKGGEEEGAAAAQRCSRTGREEAGGLELGWGSLAPTRGNTS